MNCFQIEVRGVTFTIWAPTLQDAVETFMIDMDFFEVPKDATLCNGTPAGEDIFPPECGGFQGKKPNKKLDLQHNSAII